MKTYIEVFVCVCVCVCVYVSFTILIPNYVANSNKRNFKKKYIKQNTKNAILPAMLHQTVHVAKWSNP
jgi:hypothetical protein